MSFKQLSLFFGILTFLVSMTLPAVGLEVRAGDVIVETGTDGDTYVDTGSTQVYLPAQRYYPSSRYRRSWRYRRSYPYSSYCRSYGRTVSRQRVQTSWSGRTVMRSSTYSSQCR
jgi:hypothetical protein